MTSKLFRNGTVLSFDDSTQSIKVLRNASILVENDKISALGENIKAPSDAEIIDVTGKILTPGFINTHSHLWQTAFRTMAPNTTLASYFFNQGNQAPATKSFSGEDVYISCLEGYYEGFHGGVTSWVEHAHNNWTLDAVKRGYDAAIDSGARVWWCPAVEDRDGCSVEETLEFMGTLGAPDDKKLVATGLAWDAMGGSSSSDEQRIKDAVKKLQVEAITIHHLGGPWPVGDNSPNKAAEKGLQDWNVPIVFSHCGLSTDFDISAVRKHDWNISITPESEMHYGHGQVTSRLVQDQASLGIDTNWTFSGDMLTQTRLWLQSARNASYNKQIEGGKIPKQNPMSVEDAFLLATRQGGRAVRRDDIGVLKVGAKADIVCFDGTSPNMLGWTDPIAAVILHANVGDITDTIVAGEFRKRDRKLVLKKGDWAEFGQKFAEVAKRIQEENTETIPLGKNFFGVGEFADIETMTTIRQT